MSKFAKCLGIAVLALVINTGGALAQHHGHGGGGRGGGHGGGWHGGGWGYYGGGFAAGALLGGLLAAPYYYPGPYYYGGPGGYYGPVGCGWVRVRILRHGHWVIRRVWSC
jgi:hypothetical protein